MIQTKTQGFVIPTSPLSERALFRALVGARNLLRCRQRWLCCLRKTGRDYASPMACQVHPRIRSQDQPWLPTPAPDFLFSRAMAWLGLESASKYTNMSNLYRRVNDPSWHFFLCWNALATRSLFPCKAGAFHRRAISSGAALVPDVRTSRAGRNAVNSWTKIRQAASSPSKM